MTVKTVLMMTSITSMAITFITMFVIFPGRFARRVSIGAFVLFAAAFYLFFLPLTGSMNPMYGSLRGLIYLPLIIFLFKGPFFQKVFAFFLQFVLTGIVFYLAESGVRLFIGEESELYYWVWFISEFVMYSLYIALILKFGRRFFDRLFINSRPLEWALYTFGAIFSYALMITSRSAPGSKEQFIMLILFVLWSFCIMCFAIINTHEKAKQKSDAEFARSIISSGRDHYQKMDEMYDKLRTMRHDYKYHLNAARKMLSSGSVEEANQYLNVAESKLSESEIQSYCVNIVINALVASFAERCEKLNINFNVDIAILNTVGIPNYEMCIIIGNLLENAVEACVKLEHGRTIELAARNLPDQLLLMVKNSFDGNIHHDEGTLVSEKANGGFGLRSVREVIFRYGGDLHTEWNEDTFTAYAAVGL